jgi:hypothetical protein
MSAHPSSYALERGGADVDAHVAACADCRARVEAAAAATRAFEADVVPRTLGRVRARLEAPRRSRLGFFFGGLGLAVAAAALVLVARPRPPAYDGVKGGPSGAAPFIVFVKRGADVFSLGPDQRLRAGDAVRFVARVARPRYLELRGRDAAGRERTLFPSGPRAALVQPNEALPGGFVVDAAPGPETLVALVSDRAFAVGQPPEAGVEVVRVELPKEP